MCLAILPGHESTWSRGFLAIHHLLFASKVSRISGLTYLKLSFDPTRYTHSTTSFAREPRNVNYDVFTNCLKIFTIFRNRRGARRKAEKSVTGGKNALRSINKWRHHLMGC